MKKYIIKAAWLLFVFIMAHGLSTAARLLSGCINYSFIENDSMRQLVYVFVTYVLQFGFAVLAIRLFAAKNLTDAGFNMNNRADSLQALRRFMLAWVAVLTVFYAATLLIFPSFLDYLKSFCPPDVLYGVRNLVGGSILPGFGEEPLFRSFVVLALAKYWDGGIKIGRLRLSYVSILSGFIFMTAHVGYEFSPSFTIVHIDYLQLSYTFILGIAWSTIFERTKSLLAPVLCHTWANFIQYALGYFVVFILF